MFVVPRSAGRRGRPPHDDVLTPAEWAIVHAVRLGLSEARIAARRGAYGAAGRNQEMPMTSELRLGPIGQISRTVRDIDEACAWYGTVLGLKHLFTFGKLAFFDLGGTRLYLSAEGAEPVPESTLYLRVDDIAAAYAELSARGVEFKGAPHLIHRHADGTEEWMAFFKDPEGRFLALMSQVPPKTG
jgi:catechol 2,3-dioxygenase-like lactoylglutathione lyase family enzyme